MSLIDLVIGSFPEYSGDDGINSIFSRSALSTFTISISNVSSSHVFMVFAASSGAIGGYVSSFKSVLLEIEDKNFINREVREKVWLSTVFSIALLLRVFVGAALGILAYFIVSSGALVEILFEQQAVAEVLEGGALYADPRAVGAIALVFGVFSNAIIDRTGSRLGVTD